MNAIVWYLKYAGGVGNSKVSAVERVRYATDDILVIVGEKMVLPLTLNYLYQHA